MPSMLWSGAAGASAGPIKGAGMAPATSPTRALTQMLQPQQATAETPADEGDDTENSSLGTRLPAAPFEALMDVVRRYGKVY